MGTTASGFWYPEESQPLTLRGMFSAAATAAENALQSQLVSAGTPIAASAAALTAKFTAAGTAPAVGNQGSINGQSVIWNGSAWLSTSESSGAEVTRTSAQNVPTATWTASSWSSSSTYGPVFGGPGPGGITIPVTGWYRVEGQVTFSPNGTGRRLLGFAGTTNGGPSTITPFASPNGSGNSFAAESNVTFRLPAGAILTLWAYQDSGNTLTMTNRRCSAELVHAD